MSTKKPWLPPTNKRLFSLVFLCILTFQFGCNLYIEKRRYNPGYYISSNHPPIIRTKTDTHASTGAENIEKYHGNEVNVQTQQPVIDSLQSRYTPAPAEKTKHPDKKKSYTAVQHPTIKCDIIRLLNGTEIEVMIQKIDKKTVTYKKCEDPTGPDIQLPTKTIREIELTNGKTYQPHQLAKFNKASHDYTQVTGGMIGSLILAGLALICIVIALFMMFGGLGFAYLSAIPLALAGTLSLIGLLWSSKFLVKGGHILGKLAFIIHLILQITAIVLTIFMAILFF
jgi:hypothetical protein